MRAIEQTLTMKDYIFKIGNHEKVLGNLPASSVSLAIQLGSNGKLLRARNQCECHAPWSPHP